AVTSIIAVVAIIQGASSYIRDQIRGLGPNLIFVNAERPPGEAGQRMGRIELSYEDALAVEEYCPAVVAVSPMALGRGNIRFLGESDATQIIGTTPSFQEVRNWYVDEGRSLTQLDLDHRRDVLLMGREVIHKLDAEPDEILGQPVWVNGRRFLVVGLLEEKGSLLGESQDDYVVMPITASTKLFGPRALRRVLINAQAATSELTKEAVSQIRRLLRRRHRLDRGTPDDFEIMTQDQLLEFFGKFSFVMTAILGGIVSVALVVGGIGIMNIMLVSVTERTREIGIRKAVGARGRDILWQFLVEAVTLSLLGGVIGIGGGYLLAKAGTFLLSLFLDFPFGVYIPLWAIVLSVTFSGGVGVISGFYPAFKASRLDPIEALRHE
ncbi:MAG: ABC transporter permease, partial [Planctomycetota bacterium]|nr:ABC transporter permease [Planctomycetota bacterium]